LEKSNEGLKAKFFWPILAKMQKTLKVRCYKTSEKANQTTKSKIIF
jgi:hypothetical protein